MSLIEGLAQYIGAEVDGLDYSLTGTTNVFEEDWPNDPDLAVVVRGSGGPEAALGFDSWQQNAQLMIRSDPENAVLGEQLWWRIYDKLHGLRHTTLPDGTEIVWVLAVQGGPVTIGADENGRQRFSLNVRAEVRRPGA